MIDIVLDHLLYELSADPCVVLGMPSSELVENIQAQFVAGVEEVAVWRIVAGTNGVAVHLLDEVDIVS
jgi:hypothetical protein